MTIIPVVRKVPVAATGKAGQGFLLERGGALSRTGERWDLTRSEGLTMEGLR